MTKVEYAIGALTWEDGKRLQIALNCSQLSIQVVKYI